MAGRADIEAGKAHVKIWADKSALVRTLKSIQTDFRQLGATITTAGMSLMGLGAAITAPLAGAVKHFVTVGDALDKMSARTGVSTNALSELGFAAEQSGQSMEAVEDSLKRMQRTIGEAATGGKAQADAIRRLGISMSDLEGKTADEQMERFADALAAIQDPTMRASMAMEIFGRSGTALLPMFADGAAGIRELRREARDLGLSIDPEQAKSAAELEDAINRVKRAISGIVVSIGSTFAPVMTRAADAIKNIVTQAGAWVRANTETLRTVAKVGLGLMAAGGALMGLGTAFRLVGSAAAPFVGMMRFASTALHLVSSSVGLLLSPLSIAAKATIGLSTAFARLVGSIGAGAFKAATATIGIAVDGMAVASQAAMSAVAVSFRGGVSAATLFAQGVSAVVPVVYRAMQGVAQVADVAVRGIAVGLQSAVAAIPGIVRSIPAALGSIPSILSSGFTAAAGMASAAWTAAATAASAVWAGMQAIPGILSAAYAATAAIASTVWTAAVSAPSAAWAAFTAVPAMIAAAYAASAATTGTLWTTLPAVISTAWAGFAAALPAILTGAAIAGGAAMLYYLGRALWPQVIGWARSAMATVADSVVRFIGSAFDRLKSAGQSAWGAISSTISGIVGGIAERVQSAFTTAQTWIGGFVESCRTGFENVRQDGTEAFGLIAEALQAGDLETAFSVVTAFLRAEWARLVGWVTEQWLGFQASFSGVLASLESSFVDISAKIQTVWATTLGAMQKLWDAWSSSLAVEVASGPIAWMIAKIQGLDPADVSKNLAEDFSRKRAGLAGRSGQIESETQQRITDIETQRQAKQEGIQAEQAAGAAERQRQLADLEREAADARRAMQDAFSGARRSLDQPAIDESDDRAFDDAYRQAQADALNVDADALDDYLSRRDPLEQLRTSGASKSAGTMSSYAAMAMQGGGETNYARDTVRELRAAREFWQRFQRDADRAARALDRIEQAVGAQP